MASSDQQSRAWCAECGMTLKEPAEYHPYAACILFKALRDGAAVRDNLAAIGEHFVEVANGK